MNVDKVSTKTRKKAREKHKCLCGRYTYMYVICCMDEWNLLKLLGVNDDIIFIFKFILLMFGWKLIYKHLC